MLQGSDGFDSYGSIADLKTYWAQVPNDWSFNATGGRTGGGALENTTGNNSSPWCAVGKGKSPMGITASAGTNGIGIGAWVKPSGAPGSASGMFLITDSGFGYFGDCAIQTTGRVALYHPNNTVLATGPTVFTDNLWHWIEYSMALGAGSTCVSKCYVDGISQWNLSAFGFANFTVDYIQLVGLVGRTISFDDLIWYSSVGVSPVPTEI